ncbi:lutropin-choriogonadotropic hormone receptor isoform X2 [Leptinotarsa decemlineata]
MNSSINGISTKENLSVCSSQQTSQLEKFCMCDDMEEPKCRCSGPNIIDIPANLTRNLNILVVEDAKCIEVLKSDSLIPYASTLRELTLVNLENFYYFETGVFHRLTQLQTIYIHRAPKLLKIQPDVFRAYLPKLKILRIVNTGLQEMPNLNNLNTSSILHMVDLEHNSIQEIRSRQVGNLRAEQMLLNFNNLEVVEESAFAGSEIANLSLKGNFALQNLHKRAFLGLKSLRYLDLSNTAITHLPIEGIREIDTLKLQNTKSLKVFPSVFNFQSLKEAWLTYPYHCCAFKFPRTHNPWEYEKHARFIEELQATCKTENATANKEVALSVSENEIQDEEFWGHENIGNATLPTTTVLCGEIYRNYEEVKCYPPPDAFNPCEDLMGNWGLRIPVWFISLSAVTGNLFVVIVISTSHFRLTVSKFLMCNLAIADLCIGIHLLLIATVDACSIGVYFNSAIDWQEGNGCNVAGFLTIFGNILSVYTLAVITTERWYTITWAIHLNKRLKLRNAVRVMVAGWICALLMAVLPLIGVSNYSRTSICLPLENKGKADVIYLSTLLAFNAVAFALICVCYGSMYKSIREGGRTGFATSVRSDLTVAKRMALLVFTDFACWSPIAFFGLTALLGYPLITVTQSKILLVFFYPLNSCANPCLYALLTQQYRRDFFILMGRYGLCKDRAERHKGAIGGKPLPYGTGLQYKRTCIDGGVKVSSGINHRGSTMTSMTTVVSVDCPMMRTSSRNSSRYRPESIMAMSEFSVKNMNHFHECQRFTSTDNL